MCNKFCFDSQGRYYYHYLALYHIKYIKRFRIIYNYLRRFYFVFELSYYLQLLIMMIQYFQFFYLDNLIYNSTDYL